MNTKSWKIINVPGTNDITAIQIQGPYSELMIFNVYNSCTHSLTETLLQQHLCDNANNLWQGQDKHMLWCRDFNRHHPLWDREEDTCLFTANAIQKADHLIELLFDHDMEMVLLKGVPTLQHMRTKWYSCPDNVFCSSLLTNTFIRCDVDAQAQPTKTDHFPIITILELPQERIKPKLAYNF